MGILSRDKVLGAKTPPRERVELGELEDGGFVLVRGMTGTERDAFEASCIEGRGRKRDVNTKNIRAKLVAFCAIDETGRRVFTDDDATELGTIRADLLDRIFSVAQRLSGMSEQDVDELGKPSPIPTVSVSSSSPSPVSLG